MTLNLPIGPGSLDVIGGQYACIKTGGTIIDDMVLDPYFAMKCALGENPKKAYETTRMGIAATLRNFLFQARAYAQDPKSTRPGSWAWKQEWGAWPLARTPIWSSGRTDPSWSSRIPWMCSSTGKGFKKQSARPVPRAFGL